MVGDVPVLSDRDVVVLDAVSRGARSKDIAELLHISVPTVEKRIKLLSQKFDVHSRHHLIGEAFRQGILRR